VADSQQLLAIETAALLHDMGKLAIPEHILNKPGKLTVAEFDRMKRHADIGADLLSSIRFPYPVVPIVRHHHENWNGTGYPSGISGADIPLGARILSVVDCFDALTSDRPYRPKLTNENAFSIIRERRGTMYDPLVVDTFIRVHDEIAPAAIRAGQEARSVLSDQHEAIASGSESSLQEIRINAFENSLLSELARTIEEAHTESQALEGAARNMRDFVPASVYILYTYNLDSDSLEARYTWGDETGLMRGLTMPLGERISGWSAANRRTAVNSDAHLDLGGLADSFDPPLNCALSTPLMIGDRLVAVLSLYASTPDAFTKSHTYILEHLAGLLAPKIGVRPPRQEHNVRNIRAARR
jgi:putative nucleotidyltransferase with HDIG domain